MTRVELSDGRVLVVRQRVEDLRALVERGAPGQVGLSTAQGEVLVAVSDIVAVLPA